MGLNIMVVKTNRVRNSVRAKNPVLNPCNEIVPKSCFGILDIKKCRGNGDHQTMFVKMFIASNIRR